MNRTRVSVVGGSIAGLTVAALLDPDRFAVTLHEERPERQQGGSALVLWPRARRVLAACGLDTQAHEHSSAISSSALRDARGRALIAAPDGATDAARIILRPALLRLLDQAVPHSVTRVDTRVEDPVHLPADIVVGADGVRSVVRRSAFGAHLTPRLTPWLALRGLLPGTPSVDGEFWGRGDLAGVVPAPGGTYWFTAHESRLGSLPEEAGGDPWRRSVTVDVADALTETRAVFGARPDRAPAVLDALDRATPETTLAQRVYEVPRMTRLVHGRAVLVGDAAHAMTPNLGRGACEALVDAHVLAGELSRHDVSTALRRYEARRLLPGLVLRPVSRALMHIALAERTQPARDGLLGAVGAVLPH